MAYTNNDILSFSTLFSGNTDAHGVTVVGEMVNGKAEAKSRLVYEPITPAVIQRHLEGFESIGVAPIRNDGTCSFGAIDIDDYKYSLEDVIAAIDDFNLPRSMRWFIFIVFVFMNILMNIDHGTIPAATYKIITDLSINDLIVI